MSKKNTQPNLQVKINPTKTQNNIYNFEKLNIFKQSSIFIFLSIALFSLVYRKFIFGKFVFLFKDIGSDSYNYTYPIFSYYAQQLKSGNIPTWTFQHGIGQNLNPFWFGPIRIFLWWIFGENIAESMVFIQIIHLVLAGLFFFLFLRSINRSFISSLFFATLFSFIGYANISGSWSPVVFPQEILQFSFLIFATQQLLNSKRYYFFPFAIALVGIFQPFNLYFAAISIIFQSIFYYHDNEKIQWKSLFQVYPKLIIFGVVGLFISAFQSLSNFFQLIESPRVSGDFSYSNKLSEIAILSFENSKHYWTIFLRAFSPDMIGDAQNYRGWNNYMEAPVFYCGLLTLLIFPQIFVNISKSTRKLYIIVLGILSIIIIFPFFRYAFWLFTGDYYRTLCLFIVFLLLTASSKSFDIILFEKKINITLLAFTFVGLIMPLLIFSSTEQLPFEKGLFRNVLIFLAIETFLVWGLTKNNYQTFSLIILSFICTTEIFYLTGNAIYNRKIVEKREIKNIGFNDATKQAIAYIKSIDNGFYRIEKNYSSGISDYSSFNDAHIQGYFGSRSYHSFNQVHYVNFLKNMDILNESDEYRSRWLEGLMYASYLQRLCSVKYYLTKLPNIKESFKGLDVDSLATFEDVKVLKLNNTVPFGVAYDSYVLESDSRKLTTQQKRKLLLKAVVVDSLLSKKLTGFNKMIEVENTEVFDANFANQAITELRKDSITNLKVSNREIEGDIKLNKSKILFFSIPFDKGWNAKVNNKDVEIIKVDFGLTGILLQKGNHKITLNYQTPYLELGQYLSIFSLILFIIFILLEQKFRFLSRKLA